MEGRGRMGDGERAIPDLDSCSGFSAGSSRVSILILHTAPQSCGFDSGFRSGSNFGSIFASSSYLGPKAGHGWPWPAKMSGSC